jgi:hypothetical protein
MKINIISKKRFESLSLNCEFTANDINRNRFKSPFLIVIDYNILIALKNNEEKESHVS